MLHEKHALRRRLAPLLASTLVVASVLQATAAEPAEPSEPAGAPAPSELPPAPSQNVTINLINRLVQRHVLSKEDAADLIKQAEEDAASARLQASALNPPPITDDTVRVTYIPETVKAQMRDEIRQEVMDQAREENWAAPRTLPNWVTRVRLLGDVRFRFEQGSFGSSNLTGNGSNFWNYNSINTASTPYDYTGLANPPYTNVNANRDRFRLRARVGAEIDLGSGFKGGFRIGTGESSSPVTENQTLGNSGGDFSKYGVWLDRGFIRYEYGPQPNRKLAITVGRFDNPFLSTRMLWADDLGFDGAALEGKYELFGCFTPFLIGGAFPVYNTDLNFATNSPVKFNSHDKWLEAVQGGFELKIGKDLIAKFAAAYYHFDHVEGSVSSPYVPLTTSDAGNTDDTRPTFAQKGNTYIALRNILPDVTNNYGKINQWQYFGLATPFHELALDGRIDYTHFDPFHVWVIGEYVKNLAYDRAAILRSGPPQLVGPVNNLGSGGFNGGNTAWIVTLNIGKVALEKAWDWTINAGYRYVGSDALVDGFCDSDFGGGGTNLKGITLGGSLALSPRTWLGIRWMSADSIAGPPFKEDILQVDFNAKF